MKISWQIDQRDTKAVRAFITSKRENALVRRRIQMSQSRPPNVTRSTFWLKMVSCLLTTQQRSGPTSSITRFINSRPFPLTYEIIGSQSNVQRFSESVLGSFGGIRRSKSIGTELEVNLALLEAGLWKHVLAFTRDLRLSPSADKERLVADFIDEQLQGFGPKQSRNLLLSLGLTKYEIPIDSRITKWLNAFGFPIRLSAQALSDRNYYAFVLNGFQRLCAKSNVFPVVLDAAIFASFDEEEWSDDTMW